MYEQNLVSFTPPSWKAGCGGVDMFGGSFSFINAEQLVTMMRAVAANAKVMRSSWLWITFSRMERSGWRTFRKRFKH
ncbi:conjugal transfer protein TraH [Vibrio parahaemolyticus]|nr:conjugal transfer protein TraH [Vibrio parahaemolyticus]MDN4712668.1 conjugal transfer protein TraH [Vibrio parahaemolyticus]MDN4716618.1 conjugal transfer protein TraH [Vibrio parahaemolyticus]